MSARSELLLSASENLSTFGRRWFLLRWITCNIFAGGDKTDDSSAAVFVRTVLCAIRTSPWQCAREQAGRVLDSWETILNEKRKSLMVEADAELEKKIQTSRGFSESELATEKPSKLMWTIEDGITSVSDIVSAGVARFTGRDDDKVDVKDDEKKKKQKKKKKPKKKKKKKKPQIEYVYVEKEDEDDDHHPQEIEINHIITQAIDDDDDDDDEPDYKDDMKKKRKRKMKFKGRKKGGYGDLDTIDDDDDDNVDDSDSDNDNDDELEISHKNLDYLDGDSEVENKDDVLDIGDGFYGVDRRGVSETVEETGRALKEDDDDSISKELESDDDLPADSRKVIGKGKHKKKKRGLMKLLLLGAALKAKVELLLKLLSFHLQLKFFAIATIGLIINIARFWIDMKKGHHPQKVIYYEHANHQHHYDEHGEGEGYWRRSIGDRDEPEEVDVENRRQETESEAPSQFNRRFGPNHRAIYSNTETDAHKMAFAAQRPRN